jgi:hypothetical protein
MASLSFIPSGAINTYVETCWSVTQLDKDIGNSTHGPTLTIAFSNLEKLNLTAKAVESQMIGLVVLTIFFGEKTVFSSPIPKSCMAASTD